jgi:SAM-dependent methyltransferase
LDYRYCPACSSAAKKRLSIRSQIFFICSKCNTLWLPGGPQFNNYDLSYIKERGHDISSLVMYNAKKKTFNNFWKKLGKISGPVLEVGCSTGIALKVAQEMGLDIYGLDVNENILEFVEMQGISKERVSISEFKTFSGKRFKAVAFFDSFEHLPDPKLFLSELKNYLTDKAILLIVIPIADSFSRRILGKYWPYYSFDHWIHYTLKGLEVLFSKYGIKIVKTFYPAKHLPIELIARYISINWEIPVDKIINKIKLFSAITLQFNIGAKGLICECDINKKNTN